MAKAGNTRDPKQWAGKMGVESGPVPLQRWRRENPFDGGKNPNNPGESVLRNDLRPNNKVRKEKVK